MSHSFSYCSDNRAQIITDVAKFGYSNWTIFLSDEILVCLQVVVSLRASGKTTHVGEPREAGSRLNGYFFELCAMKWLRMTPGTIVDSQGLLRNLVIRRQSRNVHVCGVCKQ